MSAKSRWTLTFHRKIWQDVFLMVEIKRMIPDQAYPPLGCGFTTRRAGDARQIFDQSPFEIPKFPMCSCHVLAKTITDTQVCYYTHPTCSSQKMPKKKPRKTVNQEVSQKHPLSPSVPFKPYIFMPASRTWETHSDSGHRLLAPRDANGSDALAPLAPVLWRLVLLLPCLWWNFEIHILGRIS